jgi:hypothetical protein
MSQSNYGGRQPDNPNFVKQFYYGAEGFVSWIYKKINNVKYITLSDSTKNVYIAKDLVVAGSIVNPSDVKVKENIEPLCDEIVNKLTNLKPVRYTYNYEETQKPHFGLLSQDVEPIYPELVMMIDDEMKGINYLEIIPILIAKINQMQKQLDLQEKQI